MELAGINVAIIVVTISIIISGIDIGAGRALSYKNIERFGVEELFQSVLNAAIVGGAVGIIESLKAASASLVKTTCTQSDSINELSCLFQLISNDLFSLMQETNHALITVGYYQTLSLNFGSFSIQPLYNLEGISSILISQAGTLNLLMILLNLNLQILSFFSQNALSLFFSLGLVFRSFFATRRLGGFFIALSLGFYIFYPAFILVFPSPAPDILAAKTALQSFNLNPAYSLVPILDLNNNNAIAEKLDNMSFKKLSNLSSNATDFSSDLTSLSNLNSTALSKILLYIVFAPLFSLLITVVFIKEISNVLGGEFSFSFEVI
ncbi:hypothetical protein HZC08_01230 [Candidatus Micrarchaeota archaeon]|nr:hypothetical protein [Candidatus Micrarchaeota archaeon]